MTSPICILIVDDHPLNLKLLRAQLEAEGHTVLDARNGVEALAVLESQPVEAVISDILMPIMGGYRLCYEIRHHPRFHALPFVVYTASYASTVDEKLSLDLGADSYLRKPASVEDLMGALDHATTSPGRKPAREAEHTDVLQEYSERLVNKLEERNVELTEASEQMRLQTVALETANAVRREWQKQLSEAHAQLRELLDHSPVITYALTLEGDRVTMGVVSENIKRLFGFDAEDTLAADWWPTHIHPDDLARANARLQETIARGWSRTEYRVLHKDDTYRWVDDNLRLVRATDGPKKELVGVWTDITEQRRAQEELQASEQRSREMLDNLELAAVMIDRDARITYCNDYFLRLTGWERDDVIGRDGFPMFITSENAEATQRTLQALLAGRTKVWHHTTEILTRSGERRIMHWNNSALRSTSGDVIGVATIGEDITSRTLAERELKLSEEHLRIIIRASSDAIWEFNVRTGEGRWSDRAYEMLGYTRENLEANYANYRNLLLHPDDLRLFFDALKAHVEHDQPYQIRIRLRHRDGSYISIFTRGQLQRETGQMVGVFTDLSLLERAEGRIREQASLIHQARDAIVIRDLEDKITFWSKGAERLYGWAEQDALGHRLNELLRADDAAFETAKKATLADGAYSDEGERTTAPGEVVTVESSWTLLHDDLGRPKAFLSIDSDITESRKAERRLQESEERYRLLFDRNPHPSWVYDTTTLQFLAANEAAVRQYGYSQEEFLRMTIKDIRPPEEIEGLLEVVAQGEPQTPQVYGVFVHRRKDGTRIDVEIASSEIAFGGRVAGLVIANDVTERRRIEQQFLRTQRLESLGTLAGGIAHDLNNLLMPILMGVTLLKRLGPDERSLKTIENIERSVHRGTDLVKRVLLFASGTTGERRVVDLSTVIAEVKAITESTFPKNISFSTDLPQGLDDVMGDQTQLTQVILNLCVNARDAMPRGGLLTISASNTRIEQSVASLHAGTGAGAFVIIDVTDTGCGISKPVLDRVFEPFFTTKAVGKGTGLGLSTVEGVLRSHHGFIEVFSEVGTGSTFRVHLPAHRDSATLPSPLEKASPPPRGNGELIMVVDDEPSILSVTQQALQAFGYTVITAADGAQAIWRYGRDHAKIAAVITDIMMPVMDGASLIMAMRRLNPAVRIIAVSGQVEPEQMAKVTEANPTMFLTKPFTTDVLMHAVATALQAPTPAGS